MKISKIRKTWILIASIWQSCMLFSSIVILHMLGILTHEKINAITYRRMKKLLNLVEADIEVNGTENTKLEKNKPYIIMSNHLSHYDIPLIFYTFPNETVRMIAKKELFKVPLFGSAMRATGCISVDRENRLQAVKDLSIARSQILSGIIIWVAPEGTRSRTGKLGQFKKGGFKLAMQTGAKIIPVCIVGSNNMLPPKTTDFHVGEKIKVFVAPHIDSTRYKDISLLMKDTENAIRSAGNIE